MQQGLQRRYVFLIQADPESVFDAITNPEMVRQYYFGFDFKCDLKPGSPFSYDNPTAGTQIDGVILEVDRPHYFVHTFHFTNGEDKPSRVSWTVNSAGTNLTELILTHDGFEDETNTYIGVDGGWPGILSGLKTLLETGKPLDLSE